MKMESNRSPVCFIIDVNVAWISKPLKRRGFLVFEPYKDFPETASDSELLEYAERTGCFVVSKDMYFQNRDRAVYVPHIWLHRYNSWEIVTKIVKEASRKYYMLKKRSLKNQAVARTF